jgi:peptidyl-prolyl cis-trans isomerase SurA
MERLRQENNIPTMEALEKAIVDQGTTVEDFKQSIRSQYLSSQVLGREVDSKIIVTTEEIRNYYETHKQDFDRPEGVRLREITILSGPSAEQQKQKADEALAAAKRGDDFVELARKYSESQTAEQGGDLGFFQKGQLAKFLEDAAAKLDKGQVSDLLTLQDAFMIVKLEDKHTGGILAFELAQDEIQDRLWRERRAPKIREYLSRLRTEGFVEVRDGYADTGAAGISAASQE